MRHAPQLCRALAEASRSLERPYIPRHVPLPSSSYGSATQVSAQPSAPTSSTDLGSNSARSTFKDSASTEEAASHRSFRTQQTDRLQTPLTRPAGRRALNRSPTEADRKVGQQPCLPSAKREPIDVAAHSHGTAVAPTRSYLRGLRPNQDVSSSVKSRRQQTASSASPSTHGSLTAKTSRDAAHIGSVPKPPKPPLNVEQLIAIYPGLSSAQAGLLVRIFRQIHALRSHAPNALLSWYEDLVWTTERQAEGAERIESQQSLSMLLRYAFQRNDLRSLIRIESRAGRLSTTSRQPTQSTAPTLSPKQQLERKQVDGVGIWPEPHEDPLRLAYNLKVAFAARQGNWLKVNELLNGDSPSFLAESKSNGQPRKVLSSGRPEVLLDAIGWGSLLRFGLGDVRTSKVKGSRSATSQSVDERATVALARGQQKQCATSAPPIDAESSHGVSTEHIEDQEAEKLQQEEAQAEAKFSVTKRLLPYLLRYTSSSKTSSNPTSPTQNTDADFASLQTPAWLLQSVLAQLAERGETASTIRIVLLALSEQPALEQNALIGGGSTDILNMSLVACVQNHAVNLRETLRIFNSITGSQFGVSVEGPAVLDRPRLAGSGSVTGSGEQSAEERQTSKSGSDRGTRIMPNQESLVLVLRKVRHPLFRASWACKLLAEFEQLFPQVKLSGRTFRMLIDKCVVSAHSDARPPASEEARLAISTEHATRSGHQAPTPTKSKDDRHLTANTSPQPSTPRRGRIKQALLAQILQDILARFSLSSPLHLHRCTTNRRRFEHTLLRAKRILLAQKLAHIHPLQSPSPPTTSLAKHHTASLAHIDSLLARLADVQRLGRAEESRRKNQSDSQLI